MTWSPTIDDILEQKLSPLHLLILDKCDIGWSSKLNVNVMSDMLLHSYLTSGGWLLFGKLPLVIKIIYLFPGPLII